MKNRHFDHPWFQGCVHLFNALLDSFKNKPNLKFLEIGSFEGMSTCWMLDNVLTDSSSSIVCVDSWKGGQEHSDINMSVIESRFLSYMADYPNKVTIVKDDSYYGLLSLQSMKDTFDFIYIDGGHTMKCVLSDAILSFPLLKPGGLMAFDDFKWGCEPNSKIKDTPHKRPEFSITTFCEAFREEIDIIHASGQVWLRKKI